MNPLIAPAAIYGVLAVFAAIVALRWALAYRLADVSYEAEVAEGRLKTDVAREAYRDAHLRAAGPRLGTYLLVAAAFCALLTPLALTAFNWIWDQVWQQAGQPDVFARGRLVHSFATIFVYFGLFLIVAALAMMRYHTTRPPSLSSEIKRLNAERA